MARFRSKKRRDLVGKSMSNSLSDIIFMLLFFFMTATTIKDSDLKIDVTKPQASELEKLEKKELVTVINIGRPVNKLRGTFGTEPRIQMNDAFVEQDEVAMYMIQAREQMSEANQSKMIVNINADREIPMGIVTQVKQQLRKAMALKINYAANPL